MNITDHAYRLEVDQRIGELFKWRSWYRQQPNWGQWMDLAERNDYELRALLKLAHRARRIARQANRLAAADGWTEPELREAWGR